MAGLETDEKPVVVWRKLLSGNELVWTSKNRLLQRLSTLHDCTVVMTEASFTDAKAIAKARKFNTLYLDTRKEGRQRAKSQGKFHPFGIH